MGIKRPLLCSPLFLILMTTILGLKAWKCDDGSCQMGQFFSRSIDACEPCPPGQYLDQQNNACDSCYWCHVTEHNSEVEEQPCTATTNTVIRCKEGYFYRPDGEKRIKGSCEKCIVCDGEIKSPCTKLKDTVCSSKPTAGKKPDGKEEGSKTVQEKADSKKSKDSSVTDKGSNKAQERSDREQPKCSKCSRWYGWDPE